MAARAGPAGTQSPKPLMGASDTTEMENVAHGFKGGADTCRSGRVDQVSRCG